MQSAKFGSRGFTLIASLLLMLMLTGFSLCLLSMVNTEQRAGGNDLNNNYAYHATEGAIEKMSSDLANTFRSIQSPNAAQICALSGQYPTWDTTVSYPVYNVSPVSGCAAALTTNWGQIQAGPDQGLYAQIIPVVMNASAQRLTGETVSMTRTAEVALIPVFQFGVFSEGDVFFGRSPDLGFAGRVHTNGDLYLGVADASNLVFGDKLSAYGNVVRAVMDNNVPAAGNNDTGPVYIPTASQGCSKQMSNIPGAAGSSTCVAICATCGSVVGGHGSAQNNSGSNSWYNTSLGTYHGYVVDGNSGGTNGTGAAKLSLPFVSGALHPFEIIRRPPPGESVTSVLGANRLVNEAQVRVLLSDKQADLHMPDWNGDPTQDIELVSMLPAPPVGGFNNAGAWVQNGVTFGIGVGAHTYYFGEAACGTAVVGAACTGAGDDPKFILPKNIRTSATTNTTAVATAANTEWPLTDGWLLVEVKWASDGKWHGVTQEWLNLGFARGLAVPLTPRSNNFIYNNGAGNVTVTDMKDAILYFQVQADRNGDGAITSGAGNTKDTIALNAGTSNVIPYGNGSQYNWYPINLYDAREGENDDVAAFAQGSGTPNGIMNVVQLDVGNLKNWLLGVTGVTGVNVDYSSQNGYELYFSDRRGMQYAVGQIDLIGEYGFEDSVNYANAAGAFAPDGKLEPNNYNGVSPEDVNMNGVLDTYGVKGVGDAFGTLTANDTDTKNPPTPYAPGHRIATFTVGRANRVTGARHGLELVDASLGSLPVMPPASACSYVDASGNPNPTGCGGFTVGSENPVYIGGNYNSNCPAAGSPGCTAGNANYDGTWANAAAPEPNHSAAAIIADAVTVLSNNWTDSGCSTCANATTSGSLLNPINPNGNQTIPAQTPSRVATTTYYRVAIAAGKTIAFSNVTQTPEFAFGMDGGVHNFLRFLEDWGGPAAAGTQQSLFYKGSLVSLFWNTYATGTFKCCNLVYNPPNRQYTFDSLFSKPQNLPPATPMFRNVDNLTYRQNQVARTN